MKKYLPLIFAEVYLISTILVFFFGPINYRVDNLFLFILYIFFYHFAYISGYVLSINYFNFKNKISFKNRTINNEKMHFKLLILFSFLAFLIAHKNLNMSEDLIPVNFFGDLINGINDSSLMYSERMKRIDEFEGGKLLNILYFFIAFTKVILIPTIVFNWKKLTFWYKFLMISISLLSVFSGISAGVNKLLFDFVILLSTSCTLLGIYNYYQGTFLSKKIVWLLAILSVFLLFFAFWFFAEAMIGRTGSLMYVEGTSPLGDIKLKQAYVDSDSIISYLYVYLSYYIAQGYYGFSQALNTDFVWTYGLGSSEFLSRQVFWVFGYDFSVDTFQHRIDSIWGEKAQWHSFYSHLANDFHFIGVIFVNSFLGFYLAAVWKSFIYNNNFYAKYLLPLFVIMIIFTPANNQVFGFLETFSAFVILSILWYKSVKLTLISKK